MPVRRWLAATFLLVAVVVAPARASVPGPIVLDFEDQTVGDHVGIGASSGAVYANRPDVVMTDSDSCGAVATPGGHFGPKYLFDSCPPFTLRFTAPQAEVSLFARAGVSGAAARSSP